MRPWQRAGLALLAAIIGGGLTYYFVGGVEPIYSRIVSGLAALVVVLTVYAAVGLLNRPSLRSDDLISYEVVLSWIKKLLRPVPGAWQWLRVALVIYLGGVTYGVTRNALFEPRYVQLVSVAVGIAMAALGLYWSSRPARG